MSKLITVNRRGALTFPKEVREKLGVIRGGQILVDVDKRGLVTLRAGTAIPVEVYSETRIEEFQRLNEAPLAGKKLGWAKAR
jgi:bifunctional DNA-binding transcriptional regulator/antitoxin component of YhaV-PrlF toxin-antitoxin module